MKPAGSLASRALRGVSWNYFGTVGRIAATFVSQIVLARLLGPEQFGVFGYALLTISLLALVVEMGLQMALVQAPTLDDETLSVALGRLWLVSGTAAALVMLLADPIAAYIFSTPQAAPVIRAMAPTLVVGVTSAVATATLSREIEFKVIQLAALGSYVVGYLVAGVGAALAGWGVWALVTAWHVQTIIACVAMAVASPRRLRPGHPFKKLAVADFGRIVMVTNMVNWVIDNGPHTAIGRWLGPTMLGTYTVANNLVKVPADHLVRNLQVVLFPLTARAQGNDAGVRRAYLTALAGIGLLSMPVFTLVAVLAEPIVAVLLGAKWTAAAAVLVPLSLAMVLHAVEAMCGPILGGRGEPRAELRIKLVVLAITLATVSLTAQWSLAAVGWGVAFVFLARWVLMNGAVMRRLHISAASFARNLAGPALLGALSWLVPTLLDHALHSLDIHLPPLVRLLVLGGGAAVVEVAVLVALPQVVLGPHLLLLLNEIFQRRPALAGKPVLHRFSQHAARAAARNGNFDDGVAMPWTKPKTS